MSDWFGLIDREYEILGDLSQNGPLWLDPTDHSINWVIHSKLVRILKKNESFVLCCITMDGHRHIADDTALLIYDAP